ncbi:MAG: hypothetical protein ACRCTZ_03650 [Sarcina sp.]
MEKELLKLQNILEDAEQKFDISKRLIRFTLMNNDSEFVFSQFYNFENNKEIISFLKNVILPSTAISILMEDNGQIVITIENSEEFLYQLESFGAEEELMNKCKNIYSKLNELSTEDNKKLVQIIEEMNFEFSEGHMIMLSLEYAKDTQTYLKNIYQEYKKLKELKTLEKELASINLCMGGFKDICKNTDKYQNEIKEKLLERLPY